MDLPRLAVLLHSDLQNKRRRPATFAPTRSLAVRSTAILYAPPAVNGVLPSIYSYYSYIYKNLHIYLLKSSTFGVPIGLFTPTSTLSHYHYLLRSCYIRTLISLSAAAWSLKIECGGGLASGMALLVLTYRSTHLSTHPSATAFSRCLPLATLSTYFWRLADAW